MRPQEASNPLLPPQRIGRYQILLRIASGGMATVYLGRARGIGGFERDVAIKVSHLSDHTDFASELVEEAKLASRLRHPNVVPVLDVGESAAGVFLVMDYVPGDSLAGLVRAARKAAEPLPRDVAMRILLDAMAGLHAAHELPDESGAPLGIVHRDFTPQNILVGTDGIARLTDFGIAKATSRLMRTRTGDVKGKARYMAPEQARGLPLDRRADVWAAGMIAWEILAGASLFSEENELAIMLRITTEGIPLFSEAHPELGDAFDDALAGALTRDPADRCPTLLALTQSLRAGCARAGLDVASSEQVAARVSRLVGKKLAERAQHVTEVLAVQARMLEIDAVVETVDRSDHPTSLSAGTPRTPGERARPRPPEAPGDALLAAPRSPEHHAEVSETDGALVTDHAPRRRRRLVSSVALVVSVIALAALAWRLGGPKPVEQAEGRAPPTASPPEAAGSTTRAAGPTAAEPSPSVAAAMQTAIAVLADSPIVEVRVGSRVVAVNPPADAIVVAREANERLAPVTLSALSLDGRTATDVAAPDTTILRLSFPPRSSAAREPRPDPSSRPPPTRRAPPQGAPTLAPNPF